MSEEHVLVIPASRLISLNSFSGFRRFDQAEFAALLDPDYMEFRPRSAVEEDPSYKQLIPYAVLQVIELGERSLFQYTRGAGQGEKRLHAKRSVGIGGHISREDAEDGDLYRSGMMRELNEELIIGAEYTELSVGFIYDDSSAVGQVHLGVVHLLTLGSSDVRAREADLVDSGFESLARLQAQAAEFETWSQLCLQHLFSS